MTRFCSLLATTILDKPIQYPAAWRGSDMIKRNDWQLRFTAEDIGEIETAMSNVDDSDFRNITRLNFRITGLARRLEDILKEIEDGRGFVLVKGLPVTRWGEDYTRCVHDTIRYFQTNQAIEFHNDGADIFALLCVRAGRNGGHSRLVSAVQVFNTIAERRPDLAEVLQQDFHVDARGQHAGGLRCQVIPIFSYLDGHLNVLLKSAYIHSAQRFDDVPALSDTQLEALELLDTVMNEPGMSMQFDLEPGDILMTPWTPRTRTPPMRAGICYGFG